STRPLDNLLPDRAVCLKCHRDARIPPPPSARVAYFSHQVHAKLGNIAPILAAAVDSKRYLSAPKYPRRYLDTKTACTACHRGLEDSDQVTPAALPAMADCLVCHTKIDPPDSCELCHAGEVMLKPASHTADFLDTHTGGKLKLDKTTCAVCHGRRFTCLGCH